MDLFHSPAFVSYALFATALCLLVVCIDTFGGVARVRSKTTPKPEDPGTIATGKDTTVVAGDPEWVGRVMRAHRNALANVIPFLLLMFLYVALGASVGSVTVLSATFTALRVAHVFTYLRGIQPWRTVVFILGQLCLFGTAIQVVRTAVAAM